MIEGIPPYELGAWISGTVSMAMQHESNLHGRKQFKDMVVKARKQHKDAVKCQQVLQDIGHRVQQDAHKHIASIVTRCLRTVFGESAYEFNILFEKKRGKTEARLVFVRGEDEVDPLEAAGGGVVDVASFALRLAALLLSQPRRRRLLVLDEPFKMVSREYRPAIAALLDELSAELKIQIIMVTHDPDLQIGSVIEIE